LYILKEIIVQGKYNLMYLCYRTEASKKK